jgi:methionyl-tRNA formyltransferase
VRVLFLGTPQFAVPTLQSLLDSDHDVVGVMTRPERRRERGGRPAPSPVAHLAQARSVPVLQPEKVNRSDTYEQVRALRPDVAVVVAFGRLLSTTFLQLPPYGCVNLHASLLPRLRGAAPIQWAVARGDRQTGLTTMQMDAGMDTGDILLQLRVPIEPEESAADLSTRLAHLGGDLVTRTLDGLAAGEIEPRPQPQEGVTMAPLLRKEDGRIRWEDSGAEIVQRVRGMQPWPVAHASLRDTTVRIFRARWCDAAPGPEPAGTVCGVEGEELLVRCGDGLVCVQELQLPSRRRMSGREAVTGRAVQPGDRLT